MLLLGPSGAGKSTLLAALAGLFDPETSGEPEGELTVDGRPAREARSRTGLVLQDPDSQVVMARAGDDVAFGLENAAVPADDIWRRVTGALTAVGFPYGPDRSTSALSGGEKQRLALAGVLARRPGLLLLDEPTANLDGAAREAVIGLIPTLIDAGSSVVMACHDRDLINLPGVRRMKLREGRIELRAA